ncbi:hypothetical protein ZHAS_00019571 [Anopheles sinensis]|uniref:Uncharacterized protein n=1 Tax=Anopheles sinensis TaxID=74873 RepID=A0A084WMR7_ANOSI|nr:hypothetical protein ZHAS_00019571 [Anopheles sinensis]
MFPGGAGDDSAARNVRNPSKAFPRPPPLVPVFLCWEKRKRSERNKPAVHRSVGSWESKAGGSRKLAVRLHPVTDKGALITQTGAIATSIPSSPQPPRTASCVREKIVRERREKIRGSRSDRAKTVDDCSVSSGAERRAPQHDTLRQNATVVRCALVN